jgi:tetratricopeptide (TPR) repeat protein
MPLSNRLPTTASGRSTPIGKLTQLKKKKTSLESVTVKPELEPELEPEFVIADTQPLVILNTPSVSTNLALRETLDLQRKQIRTLGETHDSFDQQFAELYSAYGRRLLKAGRLDDARKMFANALHNVKINNGVNSVEQRPVLRDLVEMGLATGNLSDAEEQLKRLLWIEKEDPEDSYSFDLVMKLANYYLDKHLTSRRPTETSLIGLNKSIHYFGYALRRYSSALVAKPSLPYGDFAYAHFLKRQVFTEIDSKLYQDAQRRRFTDLSTIDSHLLTNNSFSQINQFLRLFYSAAKKRVDVEGATKALLSIGDLTLLYGNPKGANTYYQLARKNAEHLPKSHPIAKSFDAPLALPAFKLSKQRDPTAGGRAYQTVPMLLNIDATGTVVRVTRQSQAGISMGLRIKANHMAKRLRFRPIIDEGELKSIENHPYDIHVLIIAPRHWADKK